MGKSHNKTPGKFKVRATDPNDSSNFVESGLITVNKKAVELTYATTSIDNKEYGDSDFTNELTINVTEGVLNGKPVPVTLESNDTDVATVSSSGEVIIKKPGSTTIKASLSSNDYYEYATGNSDVTYDLTISKKTLTLTFSDGNQTKEYGDSNFTNVSNVTEESKTDKLFPRLLIKVVIQMLRLLVIPAK